MTSANSAYCFCSAFLFYEIRRAKIDRRTECWFLMDTKWLNEWAAFVEGREGSEVPGPLYSDELIDDTQQPLRGLEAKVDYR